MSMFGRFKKQLRRRRAIRDVESRSITSRPHGLPKPLYVSLTSYPARFGSLHYTIYGLLKQTVKPDAVILWIGKDDMALLPAAVLAMRSDAFHIRATTDLRSYTKIIPMLIEEPHSYIVTADDDLYYRETWLEGLVQAVIHYPGHVLAHRSHRVTYRNDGAMQSYENWDLAIRGAVTGMNIMATGVGGVLYPPGCLHVDTVDSELFLQLAPYSDDLWLYWMTRRQGTLVRHIGPRIRILEWPESQNQNLRSHNRGVAGENGNDRAIAALTACFGRP